MGAWAADRTRPVVAVTGDGGFGQYAMELTTAVKYGMPIKHVLLDNHGLGKISKEQVAGDFPVWQTSLVNPDWAQFARLWGATGLTVHTLADIDDAVAALFTTPGPVLLHVEQDGELI
jgi:pyruvate oxidase